MAVWSINTGSKTSILPASIIGLSIRRELSSIIDMKVVVVQLVKQLIENLYLDVKRIRVSLNVVRGLYESIGDINSLLIYWNETFTFTRR